jgi:hypothetical protein
MSTKPYPALMSRGSLVLELLYIVREHPELRERLAKYITAIEWLEGIECQLEQMQGKKDFAALGSLMLRDNIGMDGKSSLEGEDVYQFVNNHLPKGIDALGLRRLSKHLVTLSKRDSNLALGLPHKNYLSARQAEGGRGGKANAAVLIPLKEEIARLYREAAAKRPNETLKFHAHSIEANVLLFLQSDPDKYQSIGSISGPNGERDYYEYIYRTILKIKKENKKQATECEVPPNFIPQHP